MSDITTFLHLLRKLFGKNGFKCISDLQISVNFILDILGKNII